MRVDTVAGKALKFAYLRAAEWRLNLGTEDRWAAFCQAARDWAEEHKKQSGDSVEGQDVESALQDADENHDQECTSSEDSEKEPEGSVPVGGGANLQQQIEQVKGSLSVSLVDRFKGMAPDTAVPQYASYVMSQHFQDILLRECATAQADLSFLTSQARIEWLMQLVDRKEIDVRGMVANSRPPDGFLRGCGSMAGNNCFISSVVQALAGVGDSGQEHDSLCADIRRRGAGVFWDEKSFVTASESALAFICDCAIPDAFPRVHVTLYSGHDGGHRQEICTEGAARQGPLRHIHIYNPVGVHFDPLFAVS